MTRQSDRPDFLAQVDVMELQGGLLGWQIEKLTQASPAGRSVAVRMGPFFRLTLEVGEGGAISGDLALTQPGGHPLLASMFHPTLMRGCYGLAPPCSSDTV